MRGTNVAVKQFWRVSTRAGSFACSAKPRQAAGAGILRVGLALRHLPRPAAALGVSVLDRGDLRTKGSECLIKPSLKIESLSRRSRTVIFATPVENLTLDTQCRGRLSTEAV
jgi:hypothetical protein